MRRFVVVISILSLACSWLALPHGAAPMARRNGTLSEPSSTRIARHSPAMTSGSHRSADSGRLTITIPQEERAAATGPQANGRSYSTSRAAGGLSQDAWASIAPTRPLSPGLQTRSSETCLGVPPRRRHSRRSATRRADAGNCYEPGEDCQIGRRNERNRRRWRVDHLRGQQWLALGAKLRRASSAEAASIPRRTAKDDEAGLRCQRSALVWMAACGDARSGVAADQRHRHRFRDLIPAQSS